MKKRIALFLPVAVVLLFTACSENTTGPEDNPELKIIKEVIDATDYSRWVYYSFEEEAVVEINEYSSDLSWDMAFHRDNVRLNGGESGKGEGAALKTEHTDLESLNEAPGNGYQEDEMGQVIVQFQMPPVYEEQPLNPVLSTWLDVDTSSMPPAYTLSENVYVLKTAAGHYVKIQFTDYTDERGEILHPTFRYAYQPDGSRSF